jgi:hypothetical protein
MNYFVYNAVRYFVIAREFVTGLCCPKHRSGKQSTPDRYEDDWNTTGDIVFHAVTNIDTGSTKIQVGYGGDVPKISIEDMFRPCRPPWFFIGCDGNQDRTAELEPYICRGNEIRMDLLRHLFPGSKKWVYIHPTTFEETDFPSNGIAIEHD